MDSSRLIEPLRLGEPDDVFEDEHGSSDTWVIAPGAVLTRCRGHITYAQSRSWLKIWQDQIDHVGHLTAAVDVFDAETYETPAQTESARGGAKRLGQVRAVYVGVASPVMRMGTAMGKLASRGRIQGCSSREEFERVVRMMTERSS